MDYDFDPFEDSANTARTANVAALDQDPEQASRALELEQSSGVPATAIYGDVEGFERQHKAVLGSDIISNNLHISDYLNSHPMAARVSHDDLGNLDNASLKISDLLPESGLKQWMRSDSVAKSFMEGYGDSPLGSSAFQKPSDLEYAIKHPLLGAVAASVATPVEFMGRSISGLIHMGYEGTSKVFGEKFAREAAAVAEWSMMRGDLGAKSAPGPLGIIEQNSHLLKSMSDAIVVADPFIAAGREPPVGIHPIIDDLHKNQAKVDTDALADALIESTKSATRDRSPDLFSNFVRSHVGDREIGISAGGIRELYGDKDPVPGDGLLGWVPGIQDKLAAAEASGGDVKVPLADWLARVDPEVAKGLHDHLRVRPDGLTIEEGKVLDEQSKGKAHPKESTPAKESPIEDTETIGQAAVKVGGEVYTGTNHLEALENAAKKLGIDVTELFNRKEGDPGFITADDGFVTSKGRYVQRTEAMDIAKKADQLKEEVKGTRAKELSAEDVKPSSSSIIAEPLQLTRGASALEPLFSVGDRKVKLERMKPKTAEEALALPIGEATDFHDFNLQDETGKTIGSLNLSEQKNGKQLYVEMIQAGADKRMYDPNFLGPALVRDLYRQLKAEFPKAFGPDGLGITGHRVSGAREKAGTWEAKHAMPVVKADAELGPKHIQDMRDLLSPFWEDQGRGVSADIKPTELYAQHEQELIKATQDAVQRIAPSAEFKPAADIRSDSSPGKVRGMYMMYSDRAPRILASMMSDDPVGVGRHEAIHHLRQYGFFKPEEWAELTRAARSLDWEKHFNIDKRYPYLDQAAKLEEAIADGFRYWGESRDNVPEKLHPIMQRLKDFFDGLKAKFKEILGKEPDWQELFGKADRGEIGRREGAEPLNPTAFKENIERPDIGGKQAEALRDQIGKLAGELSVDKSHGLDTSADPRLAQLKDLRKQLRGITNETFGLTKDNYDRYMKLIQKRNAEDMEASLKRATEQQRKTQTKEWKAARTETRDTVREEIESRPDIAVDQLMADEKLKFHPEFLTDEQKAMLPKEYIQKKNGINPDDAAGFFGYHSGDAMVERLGTMTRDRIAAGMNAREWKNHLIDAETDRRMQESHGDLAQNILDEAKDQAISETQLNLLHEETVILGMNAGEKFPLTKQELRGELKRIFDKTPIDGISTDEYLKVAGKAGRAAEEAHLAEDAQTAFREKQRQNNAMILASYAKAYEKSRKSFDRTAKTFQKREVPSVSQEWTNWIHDILQRTGNRVNRSVQDLAENIGRQSERTLSDFVEAKEAETFGLRETPVADFLLDPGFRKGMGELTAEQFAGLKASIDTLVKQGRDEKKIYAQGEAADRDVVLREMRDKLGTFPEKALPDEQGRISKAMNLPRMFMAGMTNVETLLNRWDRADPRGIFNRYITYPLAKAANYKSSLEREYAKAYGALGEIKDGDKFVDAPFADPLSRSEANPDGRPWPGFTRKHVLAMLQNAGNKGNWRVLARGFSADPEALMTWLHRNTTKADWDRAQKMGDTIFKSLVDKADVVYENMTGATVEKIPLEPIDTPHGTYPGWYHPLIADPIRKEVWVKDEDTGQWIRNATGRRGSVMDDGDYFHASTANGYTKRRTGAVYPLDLNFDVVPSRIKQMIHDISFRQTIVETEKVFGNKSFQAEVTKHYGPVYTDLLMPYLRSMAGAESISSKAGATASRVSEYLRQNAISTYIGFNPFTALKHGPTAWVMSMREVGGQEFLGAVKSLYGQSPELGITNSQFAMKHSEELQRRERHWQDTIAGQHNEIEGASTLREKIIEKGSWLVAQSDMLSAKPTWVAAYNKYLGDGLSHGESVDLADRAVRRAHGSTAQTNQPALVRGGGPLHGWLTSVYGFFGTAMQRRIEIAHTLNDTYQLGKAGEINAAARNIPKLTADILTYVVWPTMVEEWVTGMNTDDRRGWGAHLISGATMGMASSVLYLRDLVHAFSTGHDPGVGLLSSPLHDLANVVRDVRRGKEAFSKAHAGKTVGDVLTIFGEGTGMAPKTIANAAHFGIDLVNRQQHPKGITEWFRGPLRGVAKPRVER